MTDGLPLAIACACSLSACWITCWIAAVSEAGDWVAASTWAGTNGCDTSCVQLVAPFPRSSADAPAPPIRTPTARAAASERIGKLANILLYLNLLWCGHTQFNAIPTIPPSCLRVANESEK